MPFNLPSLAGRAPALLRHGRRIPFNTRSFTAASLKPSAAVRTSIRPAPSKRLGTISIVRNYSAAATDEAPNPKAYLDSGVIKPTQQVDVKKVLVIGSGGLAIGQAGEFDYSGKSFLLCHFQFLCLLFPQSRTLSPAYIGTSLTVAQRRPSSQGPERSWSRFSPHQPQHCHHSNESQPCR